MKPLITIAHARLHNQRLASGAFAKPEEVVAWMGAVQAQEYPGAKWALALRMRRPSHAAIERAFAEGRILRTHVMRPTWHFVAPADLRWLLALTAPRVRAAVASYDRKLGIDAAVLTRSYKAIAAALSGGVTLTRQELKDVLGKAGVAVNGVQHLAHLVIHAELEGVICSGPLRAKQFTYALLDERVAKHPVLGRDEALEELTRRYFTSHGPAQLQDFVWWSGLTTAEARAGVDMTRRHLGEARIEGKTYWFSPAGEAAARPPRATYLLPLYDEYLIAYKDRSASIDATLWKSIVDREAFSSAIVLDGQVIGGWKRGTAASTSTITLDVPQALKRIDRGLIIDAAARFGTFFGEDVTLRWK
jgi:hypothetical protein